MSTVTDGLVIIAETQPDGSVTLQRWPLIVDNKTGANYLCPEGIRWAEPQKHINPSTGEITVGIPGRAVKFWHPSMVVNGQQVQLADVEEQAEREARQSQTGGPQNKQGSELH